MAFAQSRAVAPARRLASSLYSDMPMIGSRPAVLVLTAFALSACAPAMSRLQSFTNLRPDPVAELGAHRFPSEWWYFNGHLDSPGGRVDFASTIFQVYVPDSTHYGWLPVASLVPGPLYFGHVVLLDEATGHYSFAERNALPSRSGEPRVNATAAIGRLDVHLGDWFITRNDQGTFFLHSSTEDGRVLDLSLGEQKPQVSHGPGWSGTATTGRMYYTSATRLAATGTLGGQPVTGIAWFDHQWGGDSGDGSSSSSPNWDWFSLQLDDNRDLMVYRVRDHSGAVADQFVSIIGPGGRETSTRDMTLTSGANFKAPGGAVYPTAWRLRLSDGTDLTILAVTRNQELKPRIPGFGYFEGAVKVGGTARGVGFMELTGYDPSWNGKGGLLGSF